MDDPCVLLRECGLIPSGWQLVVAAGPPSGVRLYSSGVRWRGVVLFTRRQEAAAFAGSSSGRRGCSCLPAMVAGVFSRSARAGCVRAGRGFECEVF